MRQRQTESLKYRCQINNNGASGSHATFNRFISFVAAMHSKSLCHLVVGLAFDKSANSIVIVKHCCLLFSISFFFYYLPSSIALALALLVYISFHRSLYQFYIRLLLSFTFDPISMRILHAICQFSPLLHPHYTPSTKRTPKLQYCCHRIFTMLFVSFTHSNSFCRLFENCLKSNRESERERENERQRARRREKHRVVHFAIDANNNTLDLSYFSIHLPEFYNKTDKFLFSFFQQKFVNDA